MAGIYIHIPFCGQLCYYCDFHFTTSLLGREAMVDAIVKEIEGRGDYLASLDVETLYFGGGTPTILSLEKLGRIVDSVGRRCDLSVLREFTVEANPEDLTPDYLQGLKALGVNRLSIGVQSFVDEHLRFMNRRHDAARAIECVKQAQEAGFDNITIDLIYGIPDMSIGQWRSNLSIALGLGVQHFSAYHLTIEPKTVLGIRQKRGLFAAVEEGVSVEEYEVLEAMAAEAGFEHYEVSNFAKKGFRAVHNSNYWKGEVYVGFGPSAHSFDGVKRRWNVSNNTKYVAEGISEEETLTEADRYNELVMTLLRTSEGVRVADLKSPYREHFLRESSRYIAAGLLAEQEGRVFIETTNFLVSDAIIEGLFTIKEL